MGGLRCHAPALLPHRAAASVLHADPNAPCPLLPFCDLAGVREGPDGQDRRLNAQRQAPVTIRLDTMTCNEPLHAHLWSGPTAPAALKSRQQAGQAAAQGQLMHSQFIPRLIQVRFSSACRLKDSLALERSPYGWCAPVAGGEQVSQDPL